MFQTFYVLLQCRPGMTYEVGSRIAKSKLVSETHSISGEWDLLLRIEIDNRVDVGRELEQLVLEVGDVERTKTFIAYHMFDPEDIYF